jgi:hypothetical protein
VHQLFIATSLQLLLPVIQTSFFSVPRFSIRRNKNPQKLNVIFLDQSLRNFTPQKLPVIQYIVPKTNTIFLAIFVPVQSQELDFQLHMSWFILRSVSYDER